MDRILLGMAGPYIGMDISEKTHLRGLTAAELGALVEALGEPRYRARQLFAGLHFRRLHSFDEITDLLLSASPTLFGVKMGNCQ